MNAFLKELLMRRGWFLRRAKGLSFGIDFLHDWKRLSLPDAQVIFDAGAHVGESAAYFHGAFPEAKIVSFEPVVANFSRLVSRFSQNRTAISCVNAALGAQEGEMDIFLSDDSQNHSLNAEAANRNCSSERVKVMTVDGMMKSMGVGATDILKIDTEGFELEVLKGAQTALASGSIRAVLCEATLVCDDRQHTLLTEIVQFTRAYSMRLTAIYDQSTWVKPIRLAYFNALFVRS